MSVANTPDFAIIQVGDGGTTETFAQICGIEQVGINKTSTTIDRTQRDCAAMGTVPFSVSKGTGKSMTVSGNGYIDKANLSAFDALLGVRRNYKILEYKDDGTANGVLMATTAGNFILSAANRTTDANGNPAAEITLQSNGAWTTTLAP